MGSRDCDNAISPRCFRQFTLPPAAKKGDPICNAYALRAVVRCDFKRDAFDYRRQLCITDSL